MTKIYIASKEVALSANVFEHSYLVYDPDNDPTNGNEFIIRGGPSGYVLHEWQSGGPIEIESNFAILDSKDRLNASDPFTDRNYTELTWSSGETVSQMWTKLMAVTASLGTQTGDYYYTDENIIEYDVLTGPNSNSVIGSVLAMAGINFCEQTPYIDGDSSGARISTSLYPGHTAILDGAGNNDFTLFANAGKYVLYDDAGTDMYTLEAGATAHLFVSNYQGVGDYNSFVFEDTDYTQVVMTRYGNSLTIGENNGMIDERLVIENFFLDGAQADLKTELIFKLNGVSTTVQLNDLQNQLSALEILTISSRLISLKSDWHLAEANTTPLVLDLDGDGVELLSMAAGVYWDIDNDGLGEQSAWVGADDGLLAYDRNDNGRIDDQSELFGSKNIDGFTLLAPEFDSNRDGMLDALDTGFSDLVVWRDANSNGFTEDGELHSLTSLNIASIDLGATYENYEINGSRIWYESSYTLTDSTTRTIVDAVFDYNNMNSEHSGEVTLDIRTAFLPTLRGYGDLPDLHIVMSQNEDLLSRVTAIATQDVTALLRTENLMSDLAEIMFRWAGMGAYGSVDGQGDMDDARKVVFLEKLFGDDYEQWSDLYHYPRADAARMVEDVFTGVMNNLAAHLLMQINGFDLFGTGIAYNSLTGAIDNTGALDTAYLTTLQQAIDSGDDAAQVWTNYIRIVDGVIGWDNIAPADMSALNTAIGNSGLSETAGDLWASLASVWDLTDGTAADDVLTGDAGDNLLAGHEGHDTLYGGDGNDFLSAHEGNDILYGQAGSNFLYGAGGDDTYIYGGEYDFIQELGGNDVIKLPVGITAGDLTFVQYSESDMRILIDGYHHITIVDQFNGSGIYSIENIELADSTLVSLLSGDFYTYGTDDDDELSGVNAFSAFSVDSNTIYGYGGNDIITGADTAYGGDGHDRINGEEGDIVYGEAGNDYLEASDGAVIYGGSGNDRLIGDNSTLYGGEGNDSYEGGGNTGNYIIDSGGNDEIYLSNTYELYVINGTDLKLFRHLWGSSSNIFVEGQFDSGSSNKIESLRYENGTVIDLVNYTNALLVYEGDNSDNVIDVSSVSFGGAIAKIEAYEGNDTITTSDNDIDVYAGYGNDIVVSGGGSDYLEGYDGYDNLFSGGGNDIILGGDDRDTLDGGDGNDQLIGERGSDAYIFSAGHDTISDDGDGSDDISLPDGIGFSDVQFTYLNNHSDLYIYISAGQTITVENQQNSDYRIEYFKDGITGEYFYAGSQSYSSGIDTVNGYYLYDFSKNGTSGADMLTGFDNADIGDDILRGKHGNDILYGKGGMDTLYGDNDNDTLYGDNGDDTLYGGSGDDIFSGGDGYDRYYGGSGSDTFIFETATAYNDVDHIHDFSIGEGDQIDISDLMTGYDSATHVLTDFLSLEDVGSDTYLRVDADGSGATHVSERILLIDDLAGQDITAMVNNATVII